MVGPAPHSGEAHEDARGLRRLLRRRPGAEERLASLIEAHRRDLDEQRARFTQTVRDLERREQLLSDAKASVERLLRLGSRDLDAREADVARLLTEVAERDQRLRDQEAELARRRSETGAVELRRVRVEQRERTLAEREQALADRERVLAEPSEAVVEAATEETPQPDARPALAFVPGTAYRLLELDDDAFSGTEIVIDGEPFLVARIGPSPLPADDRRCAYLVRGLREPLWGGSS